MGERVVVGCRLGRVAKSCCRAIWLCWRALSFAHSLSIVPSNCGLSFILWVAPRPSLAWHCYLKICMRHCEHPAIASQARAKRRKRLGPLPMWRAAMGGGSPSGSSAGKLPPIAGAKKAAAAATKRVKPSKAAGKQGKAAAKQGRGNSRQGTCGRQVICAGCCQLRCCRPGFVDLFFLVSLFFFSPSPLFCASGPCVPRAHLLPSRLPLLSCLPLVSPGAFQ